MKKYMVEYNIVFSLKNLKKKWILLYKYIMNIIKILNWIWVRL